MPAAGRPSITKRQKEQKRAEKRQQKNERRRLRKEENAESRRTDDGSDPDLAGIVAGPQPVPE